VIRLNGRLTLREDEERVFFSQEDIPTIPPKERSRLGGAVSSMGKENPDEKNGGAGPRRAFHLTLDALSARFVPV
jgi:hypothetical protein